MKKQMFQVAFVFAAALSLTACGQLEDLKKELNEVVDNNHGTVTESDKKATVRVNFTDDSLLPVADPAVGNGQSFDKAEYAMVDGRVLTFFAPGKDQYPSLTGSFTHDTKIEKGMEFDLVADASTADRAFLVTYSIDADTAWIATAGKVKIESVRPVKIRFTDLKMAQKPDSQANGAFVLNGYANWAK